MIVRRLRGLRVQLLLWTILPLAVVLIVLSLAGIFRHRQVMIDLVRQRDTNLVLAQASGLAGQIERRTTLLNSTASNPGLHATQAQIADELTAAGRDLATSYPAGLALLDATGKTIAAAAPADTWVASPAAQDLARRSAGTALPQYSPALTLAGQPALLISAPIGSDRVLVGALPVSSLDLQEIAARMVAETRGAVFVLADDGKPIFSSNPGSLTVSLSEVAASVAEAGPATGGHSFSTAAQAAISSARIDPPGWTLVSVEDLSTMETMGISVVEVLPMLLLFVAVMALLAVSFGVANVVRPLQELDRRAARVAWGDFDAVNTPVGGVQEVDDLRGTLAQMAASIRSYQTGMRDYLSAVTRAQEDERSRLAHELHDDTVQSLIALKQRVQMADKALATVRATQPAGTGAPPGEPPALARAASRLQELSGLLDQELIALRRLIGDLRPIYLEDLGFVPALETLAKQIGERYSLQVSLDITGEPVRLAPDLELAAFRIMQQALRNVVAHAAAREIDLQVDFAGDGINLMVRDDGKGFNPPDQPSELVSQGHYGIMGMRERAMLYGGHLTVESSPGQGTVIRAWLPIC